MISRLMALKVTRDCPFTLPDSELRLQQHLPFSALVYKIRHSRENRATEENWKVLTSHAAAVRADQNSYHLSSRFAISPVIEQNM